MPRPRNRSVTPANTQRRTPYTVCDLHVLDNRIRRALAVIQSSPGLDLDDIAANLNLSASRLRHLFKAQIGLSPGQYIKLLRLERAKSLLESSFLTVKEITGRVGASDVSHFVRDYKAVYGETPSNARAGRVSDGLRASGNSRLLQQLPPKNGGANSLKAVHRTGRELSVVIGQT